LFTSFFGTSNSPYLAIPTLVIALVYLMFSSIKVHGPEERTQLRDLKEVLFKRAAPLILLFFIMVFRSSFVLTLTTFLAKTYEQWGASRTVYSIAAPVFLISGAFGILVCGHLTHLIKPRRLLVITQTAFLPFLILFLISGRSGQLLHSLLFLAVCGFLVSGGHGANIVMGHRIAPEMTSTISGILMGFAWAVSSYGPTLCAYTADLFPQLPGLASGLLLLAVFPVIAAILSLFLTPAVDH
jgi:predicted MFS family arabinose efflux permease